MAPEILARSHGIILAGSPEETVPVFRAGAVEVTGAVPGAVYLRLHRPGLAGTPVVVYLTPYANELRLRRALGGADTAPSESGEVMALQALLQNHWEALVQGALPHAREGVHILLTHLLFSSTPATPAEEPEGERPIGFVGGAPALDPAVIPPEVQYVAAGHLHRPQSFTTAPPVRYAGSPLAYSFAEAEQTKSVTIVELDARGTLGEQPEVREVPLRSGRPLVRHHSSSVDAALSWLAGHPDVLVELRLELASFLSGADRQRLLGAHDGVVTIVPQIDRDAGGDDRRGPTDPTEDIDALFRTFFSHRHGVDPDPQIMALFAEVLAAGEESE
jgi:exonuclease SbcD